MTPEIAKQVRAIRKAAAVVRDSMPFDAALLAKIQYVKCRRCKNGLYGTQRGDEPCRVCCQGPTPRPGWRPTAESVALMGVIYHKHLIQMQQAELAGEKEVLRLLNEAEVDTNDQVWRIRDLESRLQEDIERMGVL